MKNLGVFATFVVTIGIMQPVAWADPLDLDSDLLEVEAALADSEAAKAEAIETQKRLEQEKKQSKEVKEKAERDIAKARREEERARGEIALMEKQIIAAQEEVERAKQEIEETKLTQDKLRLDMEKKQVELETSQRERDRYLELKKQAVKETNDTKDKVVKLEAKLDNVKKLEKSALKELTRAESDLSTVREKAKASYSATDKENRDYLRIINDHRNAVKRISKKLDEIEVEMEVDIAYDEKKERKKLAMKRSRTLASLKTGKFAKITSPACNIRTFPGTNSKIVGAYKKGRKIHVRIHDNSWYTTVYKGEKVFMGAGCFE